MITAGNGRRKSGEERNCLTKTKMDKKTNIRIRAPPQEAYPNKKGRKKLLSRQKIKIMTDIRNDNDKNDIKNINNDNDIDNEPDSLTKEEILAMDLADGLNDKENLNFYFWASRKYPEGILRKIYSQVKQVPEKKIRKSKGALFNYLIQKYEKRRKDNLN